MPINTQALPSFLGETERYEFSLLRAKASLFNLPKRMRNDIKTDLDYDWFMSNKQITVKLCPHSLENREGLKMELIIMSWDKASLISQKHGVWRASRLTNTSPPGEWCIPTPWKQKLQHPGSSQILSMYLFSQLFICCCLVTKSCPTLCDLMDCSMSGFPVLHYLPEFAQTHVHWVNDIQLSHPLSPPSPPALHLSQNHHIL